MAFIIVSRRWPPPAWYLGSSGPPPGTQFVIAGADDVIAGVDLVVVPL